MNALWNFIFEFAVILKQFYYQEYLYKLLFLNEENILGKNLLHSLPADSIFYSFYFHTEPIKTIKVLSCTKKLCLFIYLTHHKVFVGEGRRTIQRIKIVLLPKYSIHGN